jgi:hypothetical protein
MTPVAMTLDQIACARSGSRANRRSFATADECPTNKTGTAADQSAFSSTMMMPAAMTMLRTYAAAHGQE